MYIKVSFDPAVDYFDFVSAWFYNEFLINIIKLSVHLKIDVYAALVF